MHFEFDLVQGMVDGIPSDVKLAGPLVANIKSESDQFLIGCSENSLVDELSWPVEEEDDALMPDLNRLDVFSQPSYPSPDHEMMDANLPSPTAGGSLGLGSPETSYDLNAAAAMMGSPYSQASSDDSDNLIGELQSVNFADLMGTEFADGDGNKDFLEALTSPASDQLGSPNSGFDCELSELLTSAESEQNSAPADENDNEIEQIMAAATKVEPRDKVRKSLSKQREVEVSIPDTPSPVPRTATVTKSKIQSTVTTRSRMVVVKPVTVVPSSTLKTVDVSQIAAQRGVMRGEVARSIKVIRPTQVPEKRWDDADQTLNKNAIQARVNRQKKKAYIQGLEQQVGDLAKENSTLKVESRTLKKERDTLVQEVAYLKQVLANQSMLSGLLQNIGDVENARLTTSFLKGKKRPATAELDHDYGRPSKKSRGNVRVGGGVCLHVDKNNVSLEFCSKCSRMSQGAGQEDD